MFQKILLASDGSEFALRAAQATAELAKALGSSVTILHVFAMPVMQMAVPGSPGVDIDPGTVSEYIEQVQDSVARRTGRVLEEAGVAYETLNEVGHPAEAIVRIAEDDGYDLIVMGSRGMTEIKSFLLGSVSDKVSHHAHCPVLIVK
jgi:nucleotide-binding universal stress UspA family protein